MLKKYPRLFADLAFRSDYVSSGELDPAWRQLFDQYPDRFIAGTDTYTPERWAYVVDYAQWMRQWLNKLPSPLKEKLAYQNGEALFKPYQARLNQAVAVSSTVTEECSEAKGWSSATNPQGAKIFFKLSAPPTLSKLFSAQLSTCSDAELTVKALDIVMPEHRHGMNTKPEISQVNASTVKVSGLMMHMPGNWLWQIDAQTHARSELTSGTKSIGPSTERFTAKQSIR